MTGKDVLKFANEKGAKMVDLKFCDMLGTWQHLTVPLHQLTAEAFEEGYGFDGSSIRGWKGIEESDMIIMPDPSTAMMDPFMQVPTLSLICDVCLPETLQAYNRDPRQVVKKAIAYMQSTGIADTAYFGPEAEFFIFDDIRYEQTNNSAFYMIDSDEAVWNTGRDEGGKNLGYKIRPKEGYFPALPTDSQQDLRTEICLELERCGMQVERHHHEVASSQGEINFRFDTALNMGDKMMWFKYIVKNVAKRYGKTVTFMPKPIFGDNGSGMHIHMSLWKDGKNLFAGNKYAGLSEMALHYIGGVLKHAPALCGIINPTTNSYKRLVPGFEAPTKLAYSFKNRSAAMRIPNSGPNPKAKRIEFRTPDPSANIYLAEAAILMAGLDGIINKINPGDPLDKDIYGLPPQEAAAIPSVPGTLEESLNHLMKNCSFLKKGDVFTDDLIETWVQYKIDKEVRPVQQRPVPYEFHLYYDC
ncbi:type I glutamate--ammonia ligase [Bdellovibrio bacteriovorus]|uniref:Glutamine synthetase n=1 Tax=Bdellovibrio bacteriovorus (strain ATCC 15356 / DSM 50701 / NCIMB 9529 / HD100) TaxID=264462 RepID=Q6MR33_BDEBA|nr:type I glutamate--ammonia ligase [Bdellovibrio bacteriovorus]AHZ85900.1 glutamine synthetase [Bdellovibrio bacteriovorus]BEV66821.1 Glutamine synthetase [Bdellovibrio bacteriovorus]CAE77925.1 glnA [Bdellovibrio bacteriovorus HD100]